MIGNAVVVGAVVVGAAAGWSAGWLARRLLARLRRGVVLRRPWCEAVVAVSWGAVCLGWAGGALPAARVPVLLGLGWLGAAVAAVDLRHRRIPDALTLPALPVALLCALPLGADGAVRALGGAALAAGAHAAVHLASRRAL
ncbi:prepilin peptidase, partial [Pseudonocardia lacus]|uniref:prepilin peptidase n=1 Tax=Pseudonocardia lacus TaxID=2835865 RepID=UPI001BDBD0D0